MVFRIMQIINDGSLECFFFFWLRLFCMANLKGAIVEIRGGEILENLTL